MDRRRNPRVQVRLPIQVWGLDTHGRPFTEPAMVTNMSLGGLVVQGVRHHVRVGELLDVRMGDDTAQFRVVWAAGAGPQRARELGMERVTSVPFLHDSILTHCSQMAAAC